MVMGVLVQDRKYYSGEQMIGCVFSLDRGRDRSFERPPAQILACGTTALGSCLEYERRSVHLGKDASHGQAVTTGLPDGSSGSS